MSVTAADVVHKFLKDQKVLAGMAANSPYWPSVTGPMPPDHENIVALVDTGGFQEGRLMRTGERVIHPTVQIRVRGINYSTAKDKAAEIELKCDAVGVDPAAVVNPFSSQMGLGRVPVWVNEDKEKYALHAIHVTTPMTFIGADPGNRRSNFSINVMVTMVKEV